MTGGGGATLFLFFQFTNNVMLLLFFGDKERVTSVVAKENVASFTIDFHIYQVSVTEVWSSCFVMQMNVFPFIVSSL